MIPYQIFFESFIYFDYDENEKKLFCTFTIVIHYDFPPKNFFPLVGFCKGSSSSSFPEFSLSLVVDAVYVH